MSHAHENVKLDKPIMAASSVLDYSKLIMLKAYYDDLASCNFTNMKLRYTDTDSLLVSVQESVHSANEKMLKKAHLFDFSNLSPDHPLAASNPYYQSNKMKLGKLKLETGAEIINQFVGLSPKCYSLDLVNNGQSIKRFKGIPRAIVRHQIKHNQYVEAVLSTPSVKSTNFSKIVSKRHIVTTNRMTKEIM